VWVAELDGEVVGYAAVEGAHLDALYLLAPVRRRGIGTLLLDAARRHCPGGLLLHVFQKNTGARAFYVRHGFEVVEATDGSGNMEHEPDLTMRWTPVTNGTRTAG
jgi:GNAT superfamily N-acetyltransferase